MLMFISSYYRRKEDASVEEQQVRYIYKGYKYRIYPTNKQKEYFEQAFGATRFVYNHFLELQEERYKNGEKYLGRFDCFKLLTQLKQKDEYSWLKDIDRGITRQAVSNLDEAYRRFFNGLSSKPCYHLKRGHIQSFTTVQDNLKQKTAAIRVYNKSIKYYASITCLEPAPTYKKPRFTRKLPISETTSYINSLLPLYATTIWRNNV